MDETFWRMVTTIKRNKDKMNWWYSTDFKQFDSKSIKRHLYSALDADDWIMVMRLYFSDVSLYRICDISFNFCFIYQFPIFFYSWSWKRSFWLVHNIFFQNNCKKPYSSKKNTLYKLLAGNQLQNSTKNIFCRKVVLILSKW